MDFIYGGEAGLRGGLLPLNHHGAAKTLVDLASVVSIGPAVQLCDLLFDIGIYGRSVGGS